MVFPMQNMLGCCNAVAKVVQVLSAKVTKFLKWKLGTFTNLVVKI